MCHDEDRNPLHEGEGERQKNHVLLVALYDDADKEAAAEKSLEELRLLTETSLGVDRDNVQIDTMMQCRRIPDAALYLGSGKAGEAAEFCAQHDVGLVVVDDELSPSQIKNLEDRLSQNETEHPVSVIDRTMLILDIFAKHATTSEGKLQVEIAQLKYTSPRLIGKGHVLSRQGGGTVGGANGGIEARGPGETKLETDRRHIRKRIQLLEAELERMQAERAVRRSKREKQGIPLVAITGYTNAGKSTLLNVLTDAGILAEDKLFATLDPTVRRLRLPSGREILLSDTVGFINKLPHHLIEAFRSTLDEVRLADVLIVLVDCTDEDAAEKQRVTEAILDGLDTAGKPILYAYNKCDALPQQPQSLEETDHTVFLSAKTGAGIDRLLMKIEAILNQEKCRVEFLFPFDAQGSIPILYQNAQVLKTEYRDTGTYVEAMVDSKLKGQLCNYILEP